MKSRLNDSHLHLKIVLGLLALTGAAIIAGAGLAGFVLVGALAFLAAVPASIAQGRGEDRLSWYVYGVLLFPVAVGHSLMLPTPEERRGAASGDRQLRALVGGAAALFIAICVGWIASGLAAEEAVTAQSAQSDASSVSTQPVSLLQQRGEDCRAWASRLLSGIGGPQELVDVLDRSGYDATTRSAVLVAAAVPDATSAASAQAALCN